VSEYRFSPGILSLRWPRAQIFNNFASAQAAQKSISPFTPHQVFVVRNGVDLDHFKRTPLPTGCPPKMIAIGSLTRVKRWDRLLTAAFKLKQRKFQFRVQIVGDGPVRAALEQQANELNINDSVEFMGQQNDIPVLLSDALLLVHTSESEGCPNVVMEAMACGRPVVATDAGDIPSLMDDGRTGFVVKRDETDALAQRICVLLENRPLCETMSIAAQLKAEKEFGLDRLVRETLTAYENAGWSDERGCSEDARDRSSADNHSLNSLKPKALQQ
jgi:glycosyltransferase involved in cell wall biosynthesis